MKTTISIWINRILMMPFILTLFLGLIDSEFFYYSALIAFILGLYQVLFSLSMLFYFYSLKKTDKVLLLIYFVLVILYFIGYYFYFNLIDYGSRISFLRYGLYIVPILLSLLLTCILESIKKEI